MPSIDFTDTEPKPKFRRPELILHPGLPPDVHSINPRTVMGQEWWDKVRRHAYKKNNYCCWACGRTGGGEPLHGHEAYEFDYDKFVIRIKEIVALCPSCHKAVHLGRVEKTEGSRGVGRVIGYVRDTFSKEVFTKWVHKDDKVINAMTRYPNRRWKIEINGKRYNVYNPPKGWKKPSYMIL